MKKNSQLTVYSSQLLVAAFLLVTFKSFSQSDSIAYIPQFNFITTEKIEKNTFPAGARFSVFNLQQELKKTLIKLYDQGFVAASIDSISYRNDSAYVFLYPGEKYVIKKIDLSSIDPLFLRSAGVREKELKNIPFNTNFISEVGLSLITYTENHGYPFASVYLDSIVFSGKEVNAKLKMKTYQVVKILEIIIHGNPKINNKYLYNYLAIEPGDIYKEKVIANIDTRLKELPFITVQNPSAISFTDKGVIIHLFLENRKSSSFNGVVGVLPNTNSSTTGQSSIAFTGDISMHLSNLIKQGEVADIKWRGLPNKTQELDLKLNYPFVASLPVGITAALNLFKQDTSFINYNTTGGVSYLFKGNDYIKAFINNKGTSVLSQDKKESIQKNVQNATTSYGLEIYKEQLDYRLNPTKGYNFLITAQAGNKTIAGAESDGFFNLPVKSNDSVSGFIKIPAKSVLYNISGRGDFYFPFFQVTTLKIGWQGGWLANPYLFNNDLYRLGGIKTLRGFTDASLYVSQYLIGTAEYRFLLERNSFISLFFDYAYTEKITMTERVIDHPFGFGAGFSFETKAGIFSLNYAVGRQLNNPIDFGAAKIHFGFLNQF